MRETEDVKEKIVQVQADIAAARSKVSELSSKLQDTDFAAHKVNQNHKRTMEEQVSENERLKAGLAEKLHQHEDLMDILTAKQVEMDTLTKEISSWREVTENIRNDNGGLKKGIEELEMKNKKLMEAINLHLYHRAAEYKERTMAALKASQSPNRIDKILKSGQKLKFGITSPQR